jgi:hypothetical protein
MNIEIWYRRECDQTLILCEEDIPITVFSNGMMYFGNLEGFK